MSSPITIGRNPQSTIYVSEDYDIVSNDHAEIIQQGTDLTFIDHSSNGTIINGQKIQGKSVSIYHGDKIVLAGVFELSWGLLEPLIAPVGRPTVARNIRGDIHSVSDGQKRYSDQSRPTELFEQRPQRYEELPVHMYGAPPSKYIDGLPLEDQQSSVSSESRSTSAQTERELGKWNWGAFCFGWLWGVFNKVYVALVQLIPIVVFQWMILCEFVEPGLVNSRWEIIFYTCLLISFCINIWLGVKGSRMAWDNGAYRNLEHFRSSRHNWNVAAAICFGVLVLLIIISLLLFIDIISRLL